MNFHVMTLFPDMVSGVMETSIIGRAAVKGLININTYDIRDYTLDRHKKVDDYPYGGGAGMLMQPQPVYDCYKAVKSGIVGNPRVIFMTPQGRTFDQALAEELSTENDLIFLCGHYEGIDERVLEEIVTDEISIGDYVLTGGEMAAMVVIDAVSRLVPGVLSNEESGVKESFSGSLLEYPQYSRPEIWMEKPVPDVLLSGNHKEIEKWRLLMAEKRTKDKRPDLYRRYLREREIREDLSREKSLNTDMTESLRMSTLRLVFDEKGAIALGDHARRNYLLYSQSEEGVLAFKDYLEKKGKKGISILLRGVTDAPDLEGLTLKAEYCGVTYNRGVMMNKREGKSDKEREIIDSTNALLSKGITPFFTVLADDKEMLALYSGFQFAVSKKRLYFYESLC